MDVEVFVNRGCCWPGWPSGWTKQSAQKDGKADVLQYRIQSSRPADTQQHPWSTVKQWLACGANGLTGSLHCCQQLVSHTAGPQRHRRCSYQQHQTDTAAAWAARSLTITVSLPVRSLAVHAPATTAKQPASQLQLHLFLSNPATCQVPASLGHRVPPSHHPTPSLVLHAFAQPPTAALHLIASRNKTHSLHHACYRSSTSHEQGSLCAAAPLLAAGRWRPVGCCCCRRRERQVVHA